MNFTSLAFFIFLPIVLLLYWLLPNKYRYLALLVASYFFYSFLNYWLILLILASTLVSYLGARGMERFPKKRKLILALSLIACFGSLFTFKYLDFALSSIGTIFSLCGLNLSIRPLNLVLPVGISFYTFQTVGYLIDVYRGKTQAERHIGYYALFVSFFPQLVAGPIESSSKLLPELRKEHHLDFDRFGEGFKFVLSGFIKKVLIADFLALYVDKIYGNLPISGGGEILLATFLFGLVIYCDFSGYSEIALGVAKWMDVDLSKNFDRPYLSSSLREFWRRWHITLNRFFTEYVYIPLGGSKKGRVRKYLAIFLVFLLSGLWHGASLHFVLWGVVGGVLLIIEDLLRPLLAKVPLSENWRRIAGIFFTYLIVNLCWIFFRAQSINEVGVAFARIFSAFAAAFDTTFFTGFNIALLVLGIAILPLTHYLPALRGEGKTNNAIVALYVVLIVAVSVAYVHHLNLHGESSFIYFQF